MVQHQAKTPLTPAQAVVPIWSGVQQLAAVLPVDERWVLHAGPPFRSVQELPQAVRNSVLIGILYEGWAADKAAAEVLLDGGGVVLASAQDHDVVVPLAGVATPSMYAIEVSDAKRPVNRKYSVLNEGMQWCTRLGIYAAEMLPHLRWLHQDLGARLAAQFAGPVDLAPILQAALLNGDDGHARTMHASRLLADTIVSWGIDDEASKSFLYGAMAWALNYWMAASALILAAQTDDHAIVKVGGNGLRFGLQLAGQAGVWQVVAAPAIVGNKDAGNEAACALGTIGDSAVVDFVGLGGQCLDLAGHSAKALQAVLPADYLDRSGQFMNQKLPFLAGRLGMTDYQAVLNHGAGPLVLLGMIDAAGERGRVGGGVATVDAALLQQLEAWQDETTVV